MEFVEGFTMLVDKPYEWTSFDVVNKLRWNIKQHFKLKKVKVGHAGTLDPLATGLLVICVGKHTKRIDEYMAGMKEYTGTILLGKTTPSYDLETPFDTEKQVEGINSEQVRDAAKKLTGSIDQIPPIFSAKQIDGKRAYDLAREGKSVVLKANRVEVELFETDITRFPQIDFRITCSKGTYIRSLAHDLGQLLGCGATLISLRRTISGDFTIENARSVEEWIQYIHALQG
ncbi:MAG: tRNA pseudouridine(55) synthase TruB [Cryomorphaceae bacterium]|jgi:tRNA pseudouridine55 synthase|nr:tRNA pseudouridine(55) synthase TruB [Cryomorphaceae bacterium]